MFKKIIILGNSSTGKSTLAKILSQVYHILCLNLDHIAWGESTQRLPLDDSLLELQNFTRQNNWIVEGCYGDLIAKIISDANMLIFLNPSLEECLRNSQQRPWEKDKYSSLEAQNANLETLKKWIKEYSHRDDEYSLNCHRQIFQSFEGKKIEYNQNWEKCRVLAWLEREENIQEC